MEVRRWWRTLKVDGDWRQCDQTRIGPQMHWPISYQRAAAPHVSFLNPQSTHTSPMHFPASIRLKSSDPAHANTITSSHATPTGRGDSLLLRCPAYPPPPGQLQTVPTRHIDMVSKPILQGGIGRAGELLSSPFSAIATNAGNSSSMVWNHHQSSLPQHPLLLLWAASTPSLPSPAVADHTTEYCWAFPQRKQSLGRSAGACLADRRERGTNRHRADN